MPFPKLQILIKRNCRLYRARTDIPRPYTSTGTITGSSSKQQISSTPAFNQIVPITITNSQDNSTPNPYQQLVIVPSSVYGGYAASNFQNVEFFYSNGSVIPSWLQNYTSTNATWWLKLSSISASSSKTVYMGFVSKSTNLFNTVNDGEAPQLSPSYAEYDDGQNIFFNYYNFINGLPGNFQCDYASNSNLYGTSDVSCSSVSSYIKTIDGLSLYTNSTSTLIVFFDLSSTPYNLSSFGVLVGSAPFSGLGSDVFGISINGGVPGPTFGVIGSNSEFISAPPPRVSFLNNGQSNFYMWMSNQTLSGSAYNVTGNFMVNSVLKRNTLNGEFGNPSSATWGYELAENQNNEWGQDYYYIAITKATQSIPSISFGYPSNITKPTNTNIQFYVPITISNNQNVSVSNFQQMVNVPSSVFAGYANTASGTAFQNLEFFYTNGTVMHSWLENYTSSNALYWIKLPSVPAETSFTIYLGFAPVSANLFNTIWVGEAPQLSSTYAEFDNGAYVFNNYWNFAGTSLPGGWVASDPSGMSVNNGLNISAGAVYTTSPVFESKDSVEESYTYFSSLSVSSYDGSNSNGLIQANGDSPAGGNGNSNAETFLIAYGSPYGFNGFSGNGLSNSYNLQNLASLSFVPMLKIPYVLGTFVSRNQVGETVDYKTQAISSGNYSTNQYIILGNFQGAGAGSTTINPMYTNWVRVREYPPDGVMPSVSFGSVI